MKKINLYQISPNKSDITSFYRGVGPYGKLAQSCKDLDIRFDEKLDIAQAFWCDVLVMQRPFLPEHLNIIQTLKQLGKKVIVDYDDDVTNVPEHNPHQAAYNTQEVQFAIKSSIQLADMVTVSTETLKTELAQYNKKIVVVPNALDSDLIKDPEIDWAKRNRMVLWRGGESHTNDLIQHQTQLLNLAKNHPEWLFEYFGGDKTYMNQILKVLMPKGNTHFSKTQSMLQYLKIMKQMAAPIMIVPLVDDVFNRSKSNIAWIEGTMNGSVAIVPDMDSWKAPGIINYTSHDDFEYQVSNLISNPLLLRGNWEASFDYIKNNLDLKRVNKLRYEIINAVYESR